MQLFLPLIAIFKIFLGVNFNFLEYLKNPSEKNYKNILAIFFNLNFYAPSCEKPNQR